MGYIKPYGLYNAKCCLNTHTHICACVCVRVRACVRMNLCDLLLSLQVAIIASRFGKPS